MHHLTQTAIPILAENKHARDIAKALYNGSKVKKEMLHNIGYMYATLNALKANSEY